MALFCRIIIGFLFAALLHAENNALLSKVPSVMDLQVDAELNATMSKSKHDNPNPEPKKQTSTVYQKKPTENFYRNFWSPTYHAQRLNYCTLDGKECGLAVASKFCKMMGYKKATKATIEYNVGLTYFISTKALCQGWRCNGFSLITCMQNFSHTPAQHYYYRLQNFAFPRYEHYRVDWCYQDGKGCGYKAAHSFCRRMGFMNAKSYKKQEHVQATKALGNQKLCFGEECEGFSSIICHR